MDFPNISPIALQLGPLIIRWYALAYVAGIVLGYYYVSWLDNRQAKKIPSPLRGGLGRGAANEVTSTATPPYPTSPAKGEGQRVFSEKARDDLIFYAVLGVLLGGRIGYILFYNLAYYLDNPTDILMLWHGGMSFHGGLAGVLIAYIFYAKKYGMRWLTVMDYLAAATPIGLFLGRLANFINGELYGRVTTVPWGMVFPHGGDLPRHPSQLYEAGLEGLTLFLILFVVSAFTPALQRRGMVGGLFLAGYGMARFTVECFREPDSQIGFLAMGITMGQLLCLPMIAFGMFLAFRAAKRARNA